MTMNITSKQMEITPAIRQHVADRLAKLEKWQTHLINPHIFMFTTGNQNAVRCIDCGVSKLERQLNKLQHKGEARRAATSVKDANFVEEVEEE